MTPRQPFLSLSLACFGLALALLLLCGCGQRIPDSCLQACMSDPGVQQHDYCTALAACEKVCPQPCAEKETP